MREKHTAAVVKRVTKTRSRIASLKDTYRVCVHKTSRHIYAQLIAPGGGKTLASVSTVGKSFVGSGDKKAAARRVGEMMAAEAKKCNITHIAFDRSGFKYHGRIQSLADAMRENGIEF